MKGRRHLLTLLAPFPLLLLLGEIKFLQHPHISYICEIFVEHGDGDIDVGDYDQLGDDPRQQEEECG